MRMRTMRGFSLLCGSVLFLAALSSVVAQSHPDVTIQLHSKWTGLGGAKESALSVVQKNGRCYINGQVAESKLVEELLRQVEAPADSASLANLGITQNWLNDNAAPAYSAHAQDLPKVDRGAFMSSFRDLSWLENLTPLLLGVGHTDDFPAIELTIQKSDGSKIIVASTRQNVFMVPFDITENGVKRQSYNAGLARAMVELMPAKFTNRERLGGDNLRAVVTDVVIGNMPKA
jgi:hypothetical protein